VRIFRLVTSNSIEVHMQDRAKYKLNVDAKVPAASVGLPLVLACR